MPPASLKGSPKSASGSDPSCIQITVSLLGLGACEILYEPFKSRICFLQLSGFPICKSHWPSKPDVLEACLQDAGPQDWGAHCWVQTLFSLERTSSIIIILLFVGRQPRGVNLDYMMSPPLLPFFLWFLLFNFSYGKIFSASVQLILINSFSVNSCNFGVPMG